MARMKTKYETYRGTVEWCHIYKPDDFKGKRFWKLNFLPASQEVYDQMREDGVQAKLKLDGDTIRKFRPGAGMTIRRDCEKEFSDTVRKFAPPYVKDKDGKFLVKYEDGERIGEIILIGNGSEVEMDVEIYDAGQYGTGTRLLGLTLLDLIVYEKPEETEKEYDDEIKSTKTEEKIDSKSDEKSESEVKKRTDEKGERTTRKSKVDW